MEDSALKLKLHHYSKIKPLLGSELVNGVEKYVREAMPIQEEERASGKPAAKARPILKPSSTSNWNFIPMEQRKWIDIEVEKIEGPLLLPDDKIHYSVTSTQGSWSRRRCQSSLWSNCWEMQGSSIGGFKVLVRRNKINIKHSSVLVSGGSGQTFCQKETKLSRKTLVPSIHSRSFRKSSFCKCSYQSCIARQCTVTKGFYQVRLSRRKRKGMEVNSA